MSGGGSVSASSAGSLLTSRRALPGLWHLTPGKPHLCVPAGRRREGRVHGQRMRQRARQRSRPIALCDRVGSRQAPHAPLAEGRLVGLRVGVIQQVHQALPGAQRTVGLGVL